jgi:hypothetical protein
MEQPNPIEIEQVDYNALDMMCGLTPENENPPIDIQQLRAFIAARRQQSTIEGDMSMERWNPNTESTSTPVNGSIYQYSNQSMTSLTGSIIIHKSINWYRKTSFQSPFDRLFWIMWTSLLLSSVLFEVFILRMLPSNIRLLFQIISYILLTILLSSLLYTTLIDIEDPLVKKSRKNGIERDESYQIRRGIPIHTERGLCKICQVKTEKTTKHCKYCNKCIENYDHHCRWLNNCIGKRNYISFCILIVITTIILILSIVLSIYLLIISGQNRLLFIKGGKLKYLFMNQLTITLVQYMLNIESEGVVVGIILCCIQLIMSLILLIPILHLLIFHIRLCKLIFISFSINSYLYICLGILGMTTFEYLMKKRQKD